MPDKAKKRGIYTGWRNLGNNSSTARQSTETYWKFNTLPLPPEIWMGFRETGSRL